MFNCFCRTRSKARNSQNAFSSLVAAAVGSVEDLFKKYEDDVEPVEEDYVEAELEPQPQRIYNLRPIQRINYNEMQMSRSSSSVSIPSF